MKRLIPLCGVFLLLSLGTASAQSAPNTDIFGVARTGSAADMKKILETSKEIDRQDELGYSPVMLAARYNNYATFEVLVNAGAKLDLLTKKDCPLQLLIGYFDYPNFTKACALLSAKKFDLDKPTADNSTLLHFLVFKLDVAKVQCLLAYKPNLARAEKQTKAYPVDMIQYATYPFVNSPGADTMTRYPAQKVRAALLAAGSRDIVFAPIMIQNFGNFLWLNYLVLDGMNPGVDPEDVDANLVYSEFTDGNRRLPRVEFASIPELYQYFGHKVVVESHLNGFEEIVKSCEASPSLFVTFVNLGNNPLLRQCWVALLGAPSGSALKVQIPDDRVRFFDFTFDDISELITIEFKD